MNWNWDHLRFFLALARHGTLTGAAKVLSVSHTTVLRRIKTFEQELATHLFEHTPAGYTLTEDGKKLLRQVQKMEFAVDRIARDVVAGDSKIAGNIVITTTDTLGYRVMPHAIARLQSMHPGLRTTLLISNTLADISRREADIAVRTGQEPPPQLIGKRVGEVQFGAYAVQSYLDEHPTKGFPERTRDHRFIMLDESFSRAPFYRWLASNLSEGDDVTVVNGFMGAFELCLAGVGIAILPSYLAKQDARLVGLCDPIEIKSNTLWILSHAELRGTARIRVAKECLYEVLQLEFAL